MSEEKIGPATVRAIGETNVAQMFIGAYMAAELIKAGLLNKDDLLAYLERQGAHPLMGESGKQVFASFADVLKFRLA